MQNEENCIKICSKNIGTNVMFIFWIKNNVTQGKLDKKFNRETFDVKQTFVYFQFTFYVCFIIIFNCTQTLRSFGTYVVSNLIYHNAYKVIKYYQILFYWRFRDFCVIINTV